MDLLKDLNKEQQEAVVNGDGPVIVVAGAGSGKTRVLTYRVAYLINKLKVDPYNILAITFTNRAANEMKERIADMTDRLSGIWMCTFHSMCARILRYDIEKLGYDKNFSIYSEVESIRIIKKLIEDMGISLNYKDIRAEISYAKERALSPEQYNSSRAGYETYAEVYKRYEEELGKSNSLDFDDLLLKTVQLFARFPEILRKYQERFKYLLIDEFQDTNKIQYLLVKMIASYHKNIFAVGDEDQSIYGWRGANIGNLKDFQKDFKNVKIFKLERNYRSTDKILDCANKLIEHNIGRIKKKLWTDCINGASVDYRCLDKDRGEVDYILRHIAQLLKEGYSFSDFAILTRANSLTRLFEEALNLYGYPYKVYGGFKFYERKEVKDIVAYLRIITNPKDNEAILRVINFPKRGIGDKAIETLSKYCESNNIPLIDAILGISNINHFSKAVVNKISVFRDMVVNMLNANNEMDLSSLIDYVISEIGLEKAYDQNKQEDNDRLLNIGELVTAIKQFHNDNNSATLSDYLQSVSLMSDTDDIGDGQYITIATIHSAKGLEFPIVFIIGLEEGIFPSSMSIDNPTALEEERRVMYVAITRAKEKLYITGVNTRYRFGEMKDFMPSRFIKEMGFEGVGNRAKLREAKYNRIRYSDNSNVAGHVYMPTVLTENNNKDLSKFKEGVRVIHNRYGQGTIVQMKSNDVAMIAFEGLGVKEFNIEIAPISLIGN